MKQLFINTIGYNASGKSTLAKKLDEDLALNLIRGDDFRYFLRENIRYFHDTDLSYPNSKTIAMGPVLNNYRYELIRTLLAAKQNVVLDGSGFTKDIREIIHTILADFQDVTHVIIQTEIAEEELTHRLRERGDNWQKMHDDIRKHSFEPAADNEADIVLHYDQNNYAAIKEKIVELMR